MNNRPTPETDACPHCGTESYGHDERDYWKCGTIRYEEKCVVRTDLCNEREARKAAESKLAEAREKIWRLEKQIEGLNNAANERFEEIQKVTRERNEARHRLRQWQTLRSWGGTPEHIDDFIKGQQSRIHEVQDIEKTCEQLERERDEARKEAEFLKKTPLQQRCQQLERLSDHWCDMHTVAAKKRDEAWELLESEKITRNHIIQRVIDMQKERDEARELAQELLDALSKLVALDAKMTSGECTYERAYYCYYKGHYDKWKLATEALAKAKEGAK